ncbi:DUF805 domain-containing protein [Sandarakinorhabdus sp.]|uniref:DUF805 domain-containing protein n=1 Tax=Sandarakinorhabdus sp. TaxID=1916663 RepID=UPI00286DD26A|nr:DUF805 domain-containing protein [Sandarakinorhabdus sp.]
MERSATFWMMEPLRKYATFSGRARRAEYWWFYLFYILVTVVTNIVDGITGVPVLSALAALGLIIPFLAVAARRLHDTNRSGWWMLAPTVAAIPYIFGMITMVAGGLGAAAGANAGFGVLGAGGALTVISGLAMLGLGILLLVWFCTRGTDGPNRFGADPLGAGDDTLASDFA